jgi:dCTP deaminase
LDLFQSTARSERKVGILPSQDIRELIGNGKIRSSAEISDDQVQPASIDLRLGTVAYRVLASFLPGRSTTIGTKIKELKVTELDLSRPTVLEPRAVYVVPIVESLALPRDISSRANPKSTTGRLDVFTRLMTDGGAEFEEVAAGYSGELYVEIVSRTFPIVVSAGTKLNQLRFVRGNSQLDDDALLRLAQKYQLVYGDFRGSSLGLEQSLKVVSYNGDHPAQALIGNGLRISIDLEGAGERSVVAYRAKNTCEPIDLRNVGAYDPGEFWDTIWGRSAKGLVLQPGDFYLLASKERIAVPLHCAAEMEQYDASIGEFSVHYAGFFDPGFGYGESGEIKGTKAVLEVRAHELPILLEDRQIVGRLTYHKLTDTPSKIYGKGIGSSYQQQGLALSKQFRSVESARSAVPKS